MDENVLSGHDVSPLLSPRPYNWGRYKEDPTCHFLLAEFREIGQQPAEPVRFTARLAELHKNSVSPTGKFGFHMKTMAGPIPLHNDGWSDSWEEIFSNFLGHLLDLDGERNAPWPEFEHIKRLTKTIVIPRLLGDLYKVMVERSSPVWYTEIFGILPRIWRRVSRSSLMGSHFMPTTNTKSGIDELRGIDSAVKLTSHNTSGIFPSLNQCCYPLPAMKQREVIFEGMKDLCTRFCREGLLAATSADESVKDTHSHEALEGDE